MTAPVNIIDGFGTRHKARVTKNGQLITAPFGYDDTSFRELAEINTAYNFYGPIPGKQFILTGIIAKADKQVSSTVDADFVVYEAAADDTVTASKILFQTAMVEGDFLQVVNLNIQTTEGVFINAKTTDDDFHVTITGYYIDA